MHHVSSSSVNEENDPLTATSAATSSSSSSDRYRIKAALRLSCIMLFLLVVAIIVTLPSLSRKLEDQKTHRASVDITISADELEQQKKDDSQNDDVTTSSDTEKNTHFSPAQPPTTKSSNHGKGSHHRRHPHQTTTTSTPGSSIITPKSTSPSRPHRQQQQQQDKAGSPSSTNNNNNNNKGIPGEVPRKDTEIFDLLREKHQNNETVVSPETMCSLLGASAAEKFPLTTKTDWMRMFEQYTTVKQRRSTSNNNNNGDEYGDDIKTNDEWKKLRKLHDWIGRTPSSFNNNDQPIIINNNTKNNTSTSLPSYARQQYTEQESFLRSFRYLSTEKIHLKYGLTNYFLSYASMFAYAAIDRRVVVEPSQTPIALNKLIDVSATERSMADFFFSDGAAAHHHQKEGEQKKQQQKQNQYAFGILTQQEANAAVASGLWSSSRIAVFSARHNGFNFGYRTQTQSPNATLANTRFVKNFVATMQATAAVPFLSQRDFFESFPFRTIAPIDSCAVIRRMIPAENIRDAAKSILSEMRTKYKVKYWMAVHLRVEADRGLLRRSMRNMAAHKIAEWWRRHVSALADDLQIIDSFYIASGKFDDEILRMIIEIEKEKGRVVLVKSNFSANSKIDTSENKKTMVTSHEAALVDALLMKEAHVAMSFKPSTFAITAAAYRCPAADLDPTGRHRLSKILRSPWCVENSSYVSFSSSQKNLPLNYLEEQAVARQQWLQEAEEYQRNITNNITETASSSSSKATTKSPAERKKIIQNFPKLKRFPTLSANAHCPISDVVEKIVAKNSVVSKSDLEERRIMPQPQAALRGIYLYNVHDDDGTTFTAPEYASCFSKNFRDQCFRDLSE